MINILLAEDDDGDAFLLEEAIEKTQFESTLHRTVNGAEAQAFLQDKNNPRPDMIILDLNMPCMDGHEVLQWIKSDDDLKDIPVGILTTSSDDADIKKSYKNYASYYITKPKNFEDLQNIVKIIDDFWVKTIKRPKYS